MAEPRERVSLEADPLDPVPPFSGPRPGDEFRPSSGPQIATDLQSRLSGAAFLGFGLIGTAVVTHLIFFRRAKRHLGF